MTSLIDYINNAMIKFLIYFTSHMYIVKQDLTVIIGVDLGLWCLTPLSTIFQLYRGSQFTDGGNNRPVASH